MLFREQNNIVFSCNTVEGFMHIFLILYRDWKLEFECSCYLINFVVSALSHSRVISTLYSYLFDEKRKGSLPYVNEVGVSWGNVGVA